MLKNIKVPTYIIEGINNKVRKFPKRIKFWGADFETLKGEPYSLQISGDGKTSDMIWVNKDNVLKIFIKYFQKRLDRHHTNVVYFHNLRFDLSVLLFQYHKEFLNRASIKFDFAYGIEVEAVLGSLAFCRITFEDKDGSTVLMLLDSLAFMTRGSLRFWAEKLSLPFKKLPVPKYIGERALKSKKFIEYAKQDSIVQWHLAKWILERHKDFNVAPCVSSAQFSMRVLRSKFFDKRTHIPYIPHKALTGCILSYHGGRNGFYVDRPTIFKNCMEIDISSSYPYAMSCLPNFNHCKYVRTKKLTEDLNGVFEITGIYKGCKYPAIFTHDFKELKKGMVFKIWTTSYELREAIKDNSIKNLKILDGYVVKETNSYNPLKEFVNYFYEKKQNAKSFEERHQFKTILNSNYGKFIQSIVNDDNEEEVDNKGLEVGEIRILCNDDGTEDIISKPQENKVFVAGGMFNPMVATLITGFARAYLHRLEHQFNAIHSSTDSIKCNALNVDEKKLPKGLGGLEVQITGDCIVLRNKLYLHYDQKGVLQKYALHGFTGNKDNLVDIVKRKSNKYKVNRMLKVREAYRQGLKPLIMIEQDKELNVDLRNIQVLTKY